MTSSLWVVGARGLLGSAVVRQARRCGIRVLAPRLHWDDPRRSRELLAETLATFPDGAPTIAWCAGSGVTSSAADTFAPEQQMFDHLAEALAGLHEGARTGMRLFMASSFGALHAGAGPAPFTEGSPVRPISDYGEAKLAMERRAATLAQRTGARVVVGRITNLYGPGQDLTKGQGLVSVLLLGALQRRPVQVYVPFDTLRDYLYVDDAARLVHDCLDRLSGEASGAVVTKILASGQRASVAALVEHVRRIGHRRLLIVQGSSPRAAAQARDLSARSAVWPDLDGRRVTLAEGLWQTWADLNLRMMNADPGVLS